MYKQILCPVDGSPTSNCGMMEAIHLAKDQNAKLRFLHVIDMYFPIMDATGDFNVVYMDDVLRENGKKVLKKAEVAAHKAGVEADSRIVEAIGGRVSKFVMHQVKEWPADLIVMGTHGLRGVERLVMGSDAETIVRSSTVPVLLVRNLETAIKAK
jgi:nucleotide-binding universal stress UspA family protein